MRREIDQFIDFIDLERGLTENSRKAYRGDLERFAAYLNGLGINHPKDVDRQSIQEFLLHEREAGNAPATIARRLVAINVFFRFLQNEGYLETNVAESMEGPKLWESIPETLTPKEIERLLNAPETGDRIGLRDRAIIETLYGCGLRVSELTGLRLDDLQLEQRTIRCKGKGRKERIVPIGRQAITWLKRYLQEARPKLLPGPQERVLFLTQRREPMSRQSVWRLIKKQALAAGISKNVSPHTLRHSYATHLLGNDAPLRVIQEMLGHADIATTQIYTHIDSKRLQAVHNKYHPRA